MRYYPIFLDLRRRRCLVVGGGSVAQRKVRALVEAGAAVTVLSPVLTPALRRLAHKRKIVYIPRGYRRGDLEGYFLVYGATNSPPVNKRMAAEAKNSDVLINVVDRPALCSFIAPSVVRRGDLVIAVSTGGASPALAKRLRKDLEAFFGPEYREALKLLRLLRERLMREGFAAADRKRIFNSLARSRLVAYLREGKRDQAKGLLRRILGGKRRLSELGIRL